MVTLQQLIFKLSDFWSSRGCLLQQPLDIEMGAGTMHPETFLRVLGSRPWNVAYVQPSRRPADGRFGENPNRLFKHHQFQVILKPAPDQVQQLYLDSLEACGIDLRAHDVRFEEDNWESPTLGAWGIGWQVLFDGQEITQFTYFQQAGGIDLSPISVELTYGLERFAMALQDVDNVFDLEWGAGVTYRDVRFRDEVEQSTYAFGQIDMPTADLHALHRNLFDQYYGLANTLLRSRLVLPALDYCLKCSHMFNLLDASGGIGVTERMAYILRVRQLAVAIAGAWVAPQSSQDAAAVPAIDDVTSAGAPLPPARADMDREVLIEVGVEELPATWLPGLNSQLASRIAARLAELRIPAAAPIEVFSTPRRLTARVAGIAERQEDLEETITGPPVSAATGKDGQPSPAAMGFAKKQGVTFDQLTRVQTPKGEYLAYHRRQHGRSAVDVLPALLGGLLRDLAFPKQMHWDAVLDDGRGELLFGRPIRWLLFLFGGRVVPFTIGRAANATGSQVRNVEAGAVTYGHRVLASSGRAGQAVEVRSFDEYQARLAEHFVVLDHAERRDRISRDLDLHAGRLGGRVLLEDHTALLEEVADLVEFPAIVAGFYPAEFLELPAAVLTTTLVHHQHYFPVLDEAGNLKPAFLAVVNTQPRDERVIAKNAERVVTARLRDAKFFWNADRKVSLESRLDRLHTLLFHARLGSYRDKVGRVERLARAVTGEVFGAADAIEDAGAAARLAKCDLTTDMVFEFPELQGTMGGVYAREEGQPERVWQAVALHYLPVAVDADAAPSRLQLGAAAVTWAALSLADKLDTVVGLTAAGERATGSRDPYGLRRQMHGIVRILMDLPELTGLEREVGVRSLVERAAAALPSELGSPDVNGLLAFAQERVRFVMEHRGLPGDVVRSATASAGDVVPLRARRVGEALQGLRASSDFLALAALFKRVKNITRELDGRSALDRAAIGEPAEQDLLHQLDARRPSVERADRRGDYRAALTEIAALRPAVDRFFTDVFVMAEDTRLRAARLTLLADLRDLILSIADISEIVPQTE